MLLQRCEGGVDAALLYAKNMAKYMKDLIGYLEKRTMLGKGGPGCGAGGRRRPHSPALTPPPPAEMDFAKGLQKIVHSCRQSVMQEVGSLGPGCASPRPPEGPQGRGPPACAVGARPSSVTAAPAPQPHMPLLSIYSLALEQELEFGHNMVQAVGTLQNQTFIQVGRAGGRAGRPGVRRGPPRSRSVPLASP